MDPLKKVISRRNLLQICAKEIKREEGVSDNDTSTSDESPAAKLDKLQSEVRFSEGPLCTHYLVAYE